MWGGGSREHAWRANPFMILSRKPFLSFVYTVLDILDMYSNFFLKKILIWPILVWLRMAVRKYKGYIDIHDDSVTFEFHSEFLFIPIKGSQLRGCLSNFLERARGGWVVDCNLASWQVGLASTIFDKWLSGLDITSVLLWPKKKMLIVQL